MFSVVHVCLEKRAVDLLLKDLLVLLSCHSTRVIIDS